MPCTDHVRPWAAVWLGVLLAACSAPPPESPPATPAPMVVATPVATPGLPSSPPSAEAHSAGTAPVATPPPASPAARRSPATPPATSTAAAPAVPLAARRVVRLAPAVPARTWAEFRRQAAHRLVQAHPDGSYLTRVPEPLLAIPVLEVELNSDGSVRRIHVLRHPGQARDTTQMAIDAVHRAAPYGSMARLPQPWKWSEVFLFDDQRRFKPRELDH